VTKSINDEQLEILTLAAIGTARPSDSDRLRRGEWWRVARGVCLPAVDPSRSQLPEVEDARRWLFWPSFLAMTGCRVPKLQRHGSWC
jgi:hypothetical protein